MIKLGGGLTAVTQYKPQLKWTLNKYGDELGCLRKPFHVCFTSNGSLAFADVYNFRVQVLDSETGKGLQALGHRKLDPRGVTSTLYNQVAICDNDEKCVHLYNCQTGTFHGSLGQGLFSSPCGITCDTSGLFYVTDTRSLCVCVLEPDGQLIRRFPIGSAPSLSSPASIAVDFRGRILIADQHECRISSYSPEGQCLQVFGGAGYLDGQLSYPSAITTDVHGNILVADSDNNRVSMFSDNGKFLQHLLTKDLHAIHDPRGLALHPTGKCVISQWEDSIISLYHL